MVLTPAGNARGFALSTFADNFPNTGFCCGPMGIVFLSNGQVMVSDYPGNVRVLPNDADGQHANGVAPGQSYGNQNGVGLANLSGSFYMAEQVAGKVIQLNSDGTFNSDIVNIGTAVGIVADGVHNQLYVSSIDLGIFRVDPVAKTATPFVAGDFDGLSFDPVAQVVYGVRDANTIRGFRISDGLEVFNSGLIAGGPDGTALGTGVMAGKIYANENNGNVIEIDLLTKSQTIIATGGSRGDFVAVDPNGSLLLTQTDRILRLTAPEGGGFGDAPEPGSIALAMVGLVTIVIFGIDANRSHTWAGRRKAPGPHPNHLSAVSPFDSAIQITTIL